MTQSRIEDYGLIGDTRTSALVDRSGSIDWWCVPEVDGGACFANLLGDESNGHWSIRPTVEVTRTDRRYIPGTLVLETVHHTDEGSVAVLDFMPLDSAGPSIHRVVQCRSGSVPMRMEMIVRFDYGSITPWVQNTGDGQVLVAGGDGLRFLSSAHFEAHDFKTQSDFVSNEGHRHHFSLTYFRAERAGSAPGRQLGGVPPDAAPVARVDRELPVHRRVAQGRGPVAHHAEGAVVLTDRCDRRRGDDLPSGTDRERAELGLPVLVAPGCLVHTQGVADRRLRCRGGGMGDMASSCRRRPPGGVPDHVRRAR